MEKEKKDAEESVWCAPVLVLRILISFGFVERRYCPLPFQTKVLFF
jgi:hypothetical protein